MNKPLDILEAENEILRCLASLRNIIENCNDYQTVNRIHSAAPLIERESANKMFDLKREMREIKKSYDQ